MTITHIGRAVDRVDGRVKVSGEAKYAAEYNVAGLAHGHVVSSAIARGRIVGIDATRALAVPGVVRVFTHDNVGKFKINRRHRDELAPEGTPFTPLAGEEIVFSGQPVALVVAETPELARHGASLVHIEYERAPHETDLEKARAAAHRPEFRTPLPEPRGDANQAFAASPVQIAAEYRVPVEHHNPMELFATTVVRDDDGGLTVYEKTQGVNMTHDYVCGVFGYPKSKVRVVSPFVGGAFGAALRPQYQLFLAVLAARALKRSVRVSLTRQQMFTFGHRPATWQRVQLGADTDGTLRALTHEAIAETSRFEDFNEAVVNWSGILYRCDNVSVDQKLAKLDVYTPLDMRAPGACWGLFGLECAMDELAVRIGIDPIELRLRNYAERDQAEDKPFSSKELRACYHQGAERFGWARRDSRPRSMRDGHALIGWGMAGGIWEAMHEEATARAVLTDDGKLTVSSATADIGTGTYTVMTQIAAESFGLPIEDVTFKLGDSSLPTAPIEGGSMTASSVGTAVIAACDKVRDRLFTLARTVHGSPLAGVRRKDMRLADGRVVSVTEPSRGMAVTDLMRHGRRSVIDEKVTSKPPKQHEKYSLYSHSAVFAEVKVDEDLGTVQVSRVVSAVAGGRVLNPKTARNQIAGSIVWGIGMALQEHSVMDHAFGRFMTHDLADYHFPVNADVHDIDVIFVDEHDEIINPLGAKGLGEIGLVGVAAAIANAVFHATGRRVRDLPITLDKLL